MQCFGLLDNPPRRCLSQATSVLTMQGISAKKTAMQGIMPLCQECLKAAENAERADPDCSVFHIGPITDSVLPSFLMIRADGTRVSGFPFARA